jgi:tetratricopeptide (TPR) repeat protein
MATDHEHPRYDDSRPGSSLSGDSLSGDSLSGDSLSGDSLSGDSLSGDSLSGECEALQMELSSLVDGELDEVAAAGALARLESSPSCREFFDHARAQVRAHRELADPDALLRRLTGIELGEGFVAREAVHRLASIFYQLGKAYALSATDPDFRTRVFEKAVAVEPTRAHARGLVDGMTASGRGGLDWHSKRHLFNGSLERIERPIEKARKLLRECLELEDDYEPALLYLAFLEMNEGRRVKASRMFEDVFRNGVDPACRGHAAVMIGKIHEEEEDHRTALTWFRWVGLSGLADNMPEFFFARFNSALCYAHLGAPERAIDSFRTMLDRHPDRASDLAGFLAASPGLRNEVESQPGFAEALVARCPELFQSITDGDTASA